MKSSSEKIEDENIEEIDNKKTEEIEEIEKIEKNEKKEKIINVKGNVNSVYDLGYNSDNTDVHMTKKSSIYEVSDENCIENDTQVDDQKIIKNDEPFMENQDPSMRKVTIEDEKMEKISNTPDQSNDGKKDFSGPEPGIGVQKPTKNEINHEQKDFGNNKICNKKNETNNKSIKKEITLEDTDITNHTLDLTINEHLYKNPNNNENIKDLLTECVHAYATRHRYEDIEKITDIGGIQSIALYIKADFSSGLSSQNVINNAYLYGSNKLPSRKPTTFWRLVLDASSDITLRVLMLCGLVSIILGVTLGERKEIEWIDGFGIWMAVLIVIAVTAGNDWMKEKQFRKLSVVNNNKFCTVIRESHRSSISTDDLVVGDILFCETGDEFPADCFVISEQDLLVDESSLTGESDSLRKKQYKECASEVEKFDYLQNQNINTPSHRVIHSCIVLSGTTVVEGTGQFLVIAVGAGSQMGQMFKKLSFDVDPTPLQNKLNAIARDIGRIGLICSCATFFVLVSEYWIMWGSLSPEDRPSAGTASVDHVDFLTTAITILVVAIPEGLPLAVTISLAYSVGKMLKDQNYVRRLAACETMGGVNELLSDKTGTLTQNKMAVCLYWNTNMIYTYKALPKDYIDSDCFQIVATGIAVNSTAYLEKYPGKKITVKQGGSPTECALLEFAEKYGFNYEDIRRSYEDKIIHHGVFSSTKKTMATGVKINDDKVRIYVKGSSEKVLSLCTHKWNSSNNQFDTITKEDRKLIEDSVIRHFGSQGLRTLCLAYVDIDTNIMPNWSVRKPGSDSIEGELDLTCLAIVGISDPIREEVPGAVSLCHKAGVNVRLVTGDNMETAKQIALKCGIYTPESGGLALLGSDFYTQIGGVVCSNCHTEICDCVTGTVNGKKTRTDILGNPAAFHKIADRLQVLARSQPNDKYAFVTGLKAGGAVVAVTGDGSNDAAALKKADVGFAMGLSGKEAAKQAADIVLLDDNFNSIVKAIKWGRNIYDNIRKFLQFQLTINVVAVVVTFISALVFRETPLKTVQLLWVNLIMDSLASLALATESPNDNLLNRKPHSRDSYLISKVMIRNILGQTIYQLAVCFALLFSAEDFVPETTWAYITDQERLKFPDFCEFSDCSLGPRFGTTMRSGRRYVAFSKEYDYKRDWDLELGPSRHFTLIFNVFVFMQIFNMINARKIQGERNVFSGIFRNRIWLVVWVVIIGSQIFMVQYGRRPLDCHLDGLTLTQWIISIGFGFGSLLVPFAFAIIPKWVLPEAGQKEVNLLYESRSIAMYSRGRLPSDRIGNRLRGGMTLSDPIFSHRARGEMRLNGHRRRAMNSPTYRIPLTSF